MADANIQTGLMGGSSRHDTAMYAKRPADAENDPGWVTVISRHQLEAMMIRGFVPLWAYGNIKGPEEGEVGWTRWKQILQHPNGPSEFPVSQVLQLRWYKPEDCPVPGTKFPQLAGHKVKEYKCPECRRAFYAHDGHGGVGDLGHHLKYIHAWDRPSLVKYGEAVGIASQRERPRDCGQVRLRPV
jgi:hypothetical protein